MTVTDNIFTDNFIEHYIVLCTTFFTPSSFSMNWTLLSSSTCSPLVISSKCSSLLSSMMYSPISPGVTIAVDSSRRVLLHAKLGRWFSSGKQPWPKTSAVAPPVTSFRYSALIRSSDDTSKSALSAKNIASHSLRPLLSSAQCLILVSHPPQLFTNCNPATTHSFQCIAFSFWKTGVRSKSIHFICFLSSS